MVMDMSKECLPAAANCVQSLPDLLLPNCSQTTFSRLNAHAPEFVPNKSLVYSHTAPEKMALVRGCVQYQGAYKKKGDHAAIDADQKQPLKKTHYVVRSKSPESINDSLKTEDLPYSPPQEVLTAPKKCVGPSVMISDNLKEEIVNQAEFYFSDANLATDSFLMKLLKKDPEGFVSISIVATFSKIKCLAKNNMILVAALKTSSRLVLSNDGKKVRSTRIIPDMDSKEVQARTIIAENFPDGHSTEDLTDLFAVVGTVQMVRICQPGTSNNAKSVKIDYPKRDILFSNKLHALVVYESAADAERAADELTDKSNWRTGLRVRLFLRKMGPQAKNVPVGKKAEPEVSEGSGGDEESASSVGSPDKSGDQHVKGADKEGSDLGSGSFEGRKGKSRGHGWGRGRGQLIGGSNWSNGGTLGSGALARRPPGPRMPDGTRGFTMGRGRLVAACAS